MPHQEPDGLFPPAESSGTYVFCIAPDGNLMPIYEEPKVQTFPFKVVDQNGTIVPAQNSTPSKEIKIHAHFAQSQETKTNNVKQQISLPGSH
jgi:hypothetical protein